MKIQDEIKKNLVDCPNCGKTTLWQDNKNRPFCSERCKLIDLGQWADENYKINSSSHGQQDNYEYE